MREDRGFNEMFDGSMDKSVLGRLTTWRLIIRFIVGALFVLFASRAMDANAYAWWDWPANFTYFR